MVSLLHLFQDFTEKVFEAECDVSITIIVILLEDVGHPLQRNARLDEKIETHDAFASFVIGPEEQLNELRAKAVAESDKSVGKLREGDVATAIDVEAVEQSTPRS